MPFDCPRPARPLDPRASAAANAALYKAHENDPRPNALFDAGGRRKGLSPNDPSQECLRDEWTSYYAKSGGKLAPPTPGSKHKPGEVVQKCPCQKAILRVRVRYTPLDAAVADATVSIAGPVDRTLTTDSGGFVKFVDLIPGKYSIESKYEKPNRLVELARSYNGKTDWAYAKERSLLPAGSNKCNQFVYEMTTGAGYVVPLKPHKKLYGFGAVVLLPPNAGDWALRSYSIESPPGAWGRGGLDPFVWRRDRPCRNRELPQARRTKRAGA